LHRRERSERRSPAGVSEANEGRQRFSASFCEERFAGEAREPDE